MKTFRTALPLALALMSLPAQTSGQFIEGSDVVDRLVAVVGDSVVVQTQVEEEIQRMALQGRPIPEPTDPEYERLFRTILDQFVDRLLILQAAAKDSLITVDETIVDERVSERINQLTEQFGGQTALQQALSAEGMTLAEYRDMLRSEARIERVQQLFMQQQLRTTDPVIVSEQELLARFEEARGTLQQRPKTVRFRQVVVAPEASENAVEAARLKAEALLDSINSGVDFSELAMRHSDDPGTRELGGDLGWFRRGRMVREFEDAAFALFDGEVSDLVRTDFGYHIIKVERYRAGERNARHILIVPQKMEDDTEAARQKAEELAVRIRAGESVAELAAEHGDAAAPDSVTMSFEQLSELPPSYAPVRTASEGDVIGPIEYDIGPSEVRLAVLRIEEIREAGAYTFEDLRAQIQGQIQQEKRIERLLEELRARTYIDIRM